MAYGSVGYAIFMHRFKVVVIVLACIGDIVICMDMATELFCSID